MRAAIPSGRLASVAGAATVGLAMVRNSTRPVAGRVLGSDVAALRLVPAALLLVGAPALDVVQAPATGIGGLVARILLSAGPLLLVVVAAPPLLYPSLGASTSEHPIVMLGLMAGFAFAFFLTEFLPPPAGQAGTAVFGVLLALGFGWLGYAVGQHG